MHAIIEKDSMIDSATNISDEDIMEVTNKQYEDTMSSLFDRDDFTSFTERFCFCLVIIELGTQICH